MCAYVCETMGETEMLFSHIMRTSMCVCVRMFVNLYMCLCRYNKLYCELQ